MERGGTPWVTYLLAAGILYTAFFVTGIVPVEETVLPLAWSRAAMEAGDTGRLFTSLFAHGGLLHLAFNLLALLTFGTLLERTIGSGRYLVLYFVSGIAANLAHAYLSPVPVVGASGAIFGVLGTLVLLRPLVWTMLLFILPIPILLASALYVALVPLLAAADPYVAHGAHLAGMAAGMMGALLIAPLRALRVLVAWVVVALCAFFGVGYATRLWRERESLSALHPVDLALVLAPLLLALLVVWFTHRRLGRAGFAEA